MNEQILKDCGIEITDIHNIKTLKNVSLDYCSNIESKTIKFKAFPKLSEHLRGLRSQELLTLISPTGVGKSAIALNLLTDFVKATGELAIYFSLEMSSYGIAERLYQLALDLYGYQVENSFIKKDSEFLKQVDSVSLDNLIIITNRIEIHSVPDIVKEIEKIRNKKCRLVCIDYLGLLDNSLFPKDEYSRTTDNMKKLYSFAKSLDVAIINLSQTSRSDVKGITKGDLSIHSGKGSGEVENSSDFVLSLERIESPKDNEKESFLKIQNHNITQEIKQSGELDLMRLSVHKNRRGKYGVVLCSFNRKNLLIKEL